jgi:hypothetical protein
VSGFFYFSGSRFGAHGVTVGLKCWLSSRMFRIGERRKSLLVFPLGKSLQ